MPSGNQTEKISEVSPQSNPKYLLSITETASALGVSERIVWKLVNAGALRSVKLGRRRLVPAVSCEMLVSQLMEEATA